MIVIYDSQDAKVAAAIDKAHAARRQAFATLWKVAVEKINRMILLPKAQIKPAVLSAAH